MVQYRVDISKAKKVWETAPTISTVQYDIKGHKVLVELFDYGYPMWGEKFSPKGTDIRERFFFDGVRVELDISSTYGIGSRKRRYSWLPKNITKKLWDEKLLENGFTKFGTLKVEGIDY